MGANQLKGELKMTTEKRTIDWVSIHSDYRTKAMGFRELSRWYGVSDAAIRKRAKKEGWTVDPEVVRTEKVRTPIEVRTSADFTSKTEVPKPEDIVGRGHNLIHRLLDELDATTTYQGELLSMIEQEDDDEKRRSALRRAIDLPNRSNVIKSLANAFKTFNEAQAVDGKKARRQNDAEELAKSDGKYGVRRGPRLAVSNT